MVAVTRPAAARHGSPGWLLALLARAAPVSSCKLTMASQDQKKRDVCFSVSFVYVLGMWVVCPSAG